MQVDELIVSEAQMLTAGLYTAVFVAGTATMILAHQLDPQKPVRSAGTGFLFEKRVSGSVAFPELKFIDYCGRATN